MFISLLNFNNNFKVVNNNSGVSSYHYRYNLPCDTVSFSGRAKLIGANMSDAPSEINCRKAREYSEPARIYLESVLNKYVGPYVADPVSKKSSDYPVEVITSRKKKSGSIREKVVSKYSKIYQEESDQFASQVFDEMIQYFKLKKGVDKETVVKTINSVIDPVVGQKKLPPYKNCPFYLSEIMDLLFEYNIFDVESVNQDELGKIYLEILESLEDSDPDNSLDDLSYVDPTNINGIKHYSRDIVGARIIMRDGSPNDTSKVIDALKDAVKDGVLKITSIENNVPDSERLPENAQISDYIYATDAQLRSLAKDAGAKLIKNKSKTGYLAIHINVDLSSDLLRGANPNFDGYSGEIQIIGADVERLKDIEDLCYKLKDNKNAIHVAYKPFKDHFLKYYNESTKDAFDDYTYALYLSQRSIPPGHRKTAAFLSLKDLGFDKKLPPELDFNLLRKIKAECDNTFNEMEEQSASLKSVKSSINTEKLNSDIKTAKYLISASLK